MEFRTTVTCSKCKQPIVSGEGFGFVFRLEPVDSGSRRVAAVHDEPIAKYERLAPRKQDRVPAGVDCILHTGAIPQDPGRREHRKRRVR